MKAVIRTKYGPPEILSVKEIDKPTPKSNEILVKVHAATVNRTDCGILWGKPFIIKFFIGIPKPKLSITGTDFVGVVEETGADVTNFKKGERVWGFDDGGLASHAEFLTIATNKAVLKIPEKISFERAVASAEGAHYAYNFINKVDLKPGQKVLVNGATGAIGSAAVQILKHFNVEVTATCGTDNTAKVKSIGADRVIDYLKEDFTQDNETYDFVFDAVGKSTFQKCKRLLNKNGIYISSELGPYAQNIFFALAAPLMKDKKVKFPLPVNIKASLEFIKELLEKDKFSPLIDRKYKLEEIAEAYRYVDSGKKIGNVIISF